jgi:dihydrofolate reductase
MRKVIASLFASVDGFAADTPNADMRWVNEGMGMETIGFGLEQMRALDTLVLGRVTYETMAAYWPSAGEEEGEFAGLMNNIPKVVFSRTLREEDVTWENTRLAKGDLVEEITSLKHQLGNDIGLSGSVELVRALVKRGLIDRLRLQVHPVILGTTGGKPIFDDYDKTDLTLVETTVLDSRVVVLDYKPTLSTYQRARLYQQAINGPAREPAGI